MKPTIPNSNLAVLSAKLSGSTDGWYQLLPSGQFQTRDGRPESWYLDSVIAERLIESTSALNQPILIDYDHSTLHKETTGKEAPAAGWVKNARADIEWREDGLYIRPSWTERAQNYIDSREFAFLSAVFEFDSNGHPIILRMCALTNDPAVTGMRSVAALSAKLFSIQQQETPMNESLKILLLALGVLSEESDSASLSDEEITTLTGQAASAIAALKTAAEAASEVKTAVESSGSAEAVVTTVEDVVADASTAIDEASEIVK